MNGDNTMFETKKITEFSREEILAYVQEFEDNDEECNVLWAITPVTVDMILEECRRDSDPHERQYGFVHDGELIGFSRVTPHPLHVENGNIGIGIRPSQRRKGYAYLLIESLLNTADEFKRYNNLTAVIDVNNLKSQRAFEKAGFTPTGKIYDWIGMRKAIELVMPCQGTEQRI